jgi:hypothetical protein
MSKKETGRGQECAMKFILLCGKRLISILEPDEISPADLHAAGVDDETILRVNEQGDIEVRRKTGWDVIGGLLGDYDSRLRHATGQDWAE